MSHAMIFGLTAQVWLQLFHDCHEWHWDGGEWAAKGGKNRVLKGGYWTRTEWPDAGSLTEQDNRVVDIFRTIHDEEACQFSAKVK